jgi:hypothetical protein
LYIYLFFFISLVSAVLIEYFGDKTTSSIFLIFIVIALLLISANREGIGTDFFTYKDIYNDVISYKDNNVELGYVYLNYFASLFGGFKVVLFMTTLINLGAIFFILKRLRLNISMGLLTYYSLFFFNHNFNTIRHGVMCTLTWVAFYFYYKREKIKTIIYFVLGAFFHSLSLFFVPFLLIFRRNIKLKISIALLILFFFIGNYTTELVQNLNVYMSLFSNRLDFYLYDYYGDEIPKYNFGLGFFLYIIVFIMIYCFRNYFKDKDEIVFFNKVLYLGISMILIFSSISIFTERIANLLLISLVFIFSSINKLNAPNNYRFLVLFLLIFINFFYFFKIVHLPGINRQYQFLPYTYTFF